MASANAEFTVAVERTPIAPPRIPVYSNITAVPLHNVNQIRTELSGQLTQPVRWQELVAAMIDDGISRFIELGSGDVLTKLLRRIDRNLSRITINDSETLASFAQQG
jgi:[acyl-carrier-protein] S-malonyltransferase